jgi:peptidoglycan/LPS O-acetylase OafA/YrhL
MPSRPPLQAALSALTSVISGFSISGHIQDNLLRGRFSYLDFYARRIRRILPALVVVLLTTLLLGWTLLLPSELAQLIKHVVAGAGFASNFLLLSEVGYFDSLSELKPLLHLWSLGVEEQFYIVWPIVLFLVWKMGHSIERAIIICGALSFVLNVALIRYYPSATFYLPFTRFWELLAGAGLASFNRRNIPQPALASHALSIVGLALIVVAAVYLKSNAAFPGWRALAPTVGAVMCIAAGPQAVFNRFILSNRLAVGIGLVSYPLYLWHWPLLSFLDVTKVAPDANWNRWLRTIVIGISIVLAAGTYKFIETPIRRRPVPFFAPQLAFGLVATAVCAIIVGNSSTLSMLLKFTPPDAYDWAATNNTTTECQKKYGLPQYPEPFCVESRPELPPSIILIGDSNANHWWPGLAAANPSVNVLNMGAGGCIPVDGVESFSPLDDLPHQRICRVAISMAFTLARSRPSIRHIVLSARMTKHFPGKPYGELNTDIARVLKSEDGDSNAAIYVPALLRTLTEFVELGKKLSIVLQVPELGFDPKTCSRVRVTNIYTSVREPCAVPRPDVDRRQAEYKALLLSVLRNFPTINVLDPIETLCDESWCQAQDRAIPYYRDLDHLSEIGSTTLWPKLTVSRSLTKQD